MRSRPTRGIGELDALCLPDGRCEGKVGSFCCCSTVLIFAGAFCPVCVVSRVHADGGGEGEWNG